MYKLVIRKDMKLTPHHSERFLTLNTLEGQRSLRPWWIDELADIIRNGLFLTGLIGIAILEYENGKRILVNGQHQCNAVILAKIPIEVRYEEHSCPTPEDLSLLYQQYDNHAIRTLGNKTKMEVFTLGLEWSPRIASYVIGAATTSDGKKYSRNEKVGLIKFHQKFGEFLEKLLSNGNGERSKHLHRIPVATAILQTWKVSQSDSEVFWAQVRDGEGLNRSMPSFKIREYLMTHNYGAGRGSHGNNVVSSHEMTSKSITAWNAFRKGQPTDLKYFPGKPIPKAI